MTAMASDWIGLLARVVKGVRTRRCRRIQKETPNKIMARPQPIAAATLMLELFRAGLLSYRAQGNLFRDKHSRMATAIIARAKLIGPVTKNPEQPAQISGLWAGHLSALY